MSEIKKRTAKAEIISTILQYDADSSSVLDDRERASDGSVQSAETTTLTTDCIVSEQDNSIEIQYDESEITGMGGSTTRICFNKKTPALVSLLREGEVSTALVFEAGRRHFCVYETPYFPIELCVNTLQMNNAITFDGGTLTAEYLIEMGGVLTEKTNLKLSILN